MLLLSASCSALNSREKLVLDTSEAMLVLDSFSVLILISLRGGLKRTQRVRICLDSRDSSADFDSDLNKEKASKLFAACAMLQRPLRYK